MYLCTSWMSLCTEPGLKRLILGGTFQKKHPWRSHHFNRINLCHGRWSAPWLCHSEHRTSESSCFLTPRFGNAPPYIWLWAKSDSGASWRGWELAHGGRGSSAARWHQHCLLPLSAGQSLGWSPQPGQIRGVEGTVKEEQGREASRSKRN